MGQVLTSATMSVEEPPPPEVGMRPFAILVMEADGALSLADGSALPLLGVTLEPDGGALPPERAEALLRPIAPLWRGLKGALRGRGSQRFVEREGRIFDLRFHRRLPQGGAFVLAVDVTEQCNTARQLERSEARLTEAQQLAHVGSFEWDVVGGRIRWSDEMHAIYGIPRSDFNGTVEAYFAHVHPDDVELTRRMLMDRAVRPGPFEYTHRIVRSDGSTRVLHTRGDVVTDDDGEPVRMVGSCWDITELRSTTERLERSLSLVQATLEATEEGILVIDLEGRITAYNQRFLELWKIPEERAALDDAALLETAMTQIEDPEGFLKKIQEVYEQPELTRLDIIRFNSGQVLERYTRPQRLHGESVGRVWAFRDVTEQKQRLARSELLAAASRLLVSLDADQALEGVGQLAIPFLGEACAIELTSPHVRRRTLIPGDYPHPERLLTASVPREGAYAARCAGRWCLTAPLEVKGVTIGLISFVSREGRDYGQEDRELAEELGRRCALALESSRALDAARDALKARDELLAIAAHEIRGPLMSLHVAAQGLATGKLEGGRAKTLLAIIEREDRRLARFVDDLVEFGRSRDELPTLRFEKVDLHDVVETVLERNHSEIVRSGCTVSVDVEGAVVGTWDRFRLEQIVTNLLSNALKFGRGTPVSIRLTANDDRATLQIKDEGIGLPEERREAIFDPFERQVSTRNYGGLGLGLYIARTLTRALGGEIQVRSKLGEGATFTVELPVRQRRGCADES